MKMHIVRIMIDYERKKSCAVEETQYFKYRPLRGDASGS